MSVGGNIVIGTTLAVAFIDGGLTACIVALGAGAVSYGMTRRIANMKPQQILAYQRRIHEMNYERAKANGKNEEDLKAMKKDSEVQIAQLEKTFEEQRWGNKEMAVLVGVGTFAFPPFAVPVIAAYTSDKWLPSAKKVFSRIAAAHERYKDSVRAERALADHYSQIIGTAFERR